MSSNKTNQQNNDRIKKTMRKIKLGLLAAASACMLAALPAQANLVVNGDFETGTFTPWAPVNATITSVAADVHSGTYAAQLNPTVSSITQPIAGLAAGTYYLDFWAKANGAGTMSLTLDGAAGVPNLVFGVNLGVTYAHYFYTLTTFTGGNLTFNWADGILPGQTFSAFADDINLVPEPTTMIAGAMLLLPFAASTLRGLRKRVALA